MKQYTWQASPAAPERFLLAFFGAVEAADMVEATMKVAKQLKKLGLSSNTYAMNLTIKEQPGMWMSAIPDLYELKKDENNSIGERQCP